MGKATQKRGAASDAAPDTPSINRAESPISWLYARGYLSQRQYAAGEALRNDWERAQFDGMTTMRWAELTDAGRRRAAPERFSPGERALAARRRFDEALGHAGRDMNDLCWRVICACETLPMVEKDLGWPARSGKLVLRMALDRIADYYRIAEDRDCARA